MNKVIRSHVINGDGSGQSLQDVGSAGDVREAASPASSAAAAGLAAAVDEATAQAKAAAAAPKSKAPAAAVQPAFEPPSTPASERDANHGVGGQYHIVDGKRVRVEPDLKR
jgi:hypothetical protein